MSFPINSWFNICRPVRGLVCGLHQQTTKGTITTVPLICNPSTGQSLSLPKVKTRRKVVINFFGFDPIGKNFKVLCMTSSRTRSFSEEHQILTLETGKKPSWKMIKCDILHNPIAVKTNGFPQYDGICINGVLYYLAVVNAVSDIVCFEFGSDKFSYIKKADHSLYPFPSTLVNYKGKIAKLQLYIYNRICPGLLLWVLEDAEKHEWSIYVYILPPPWRNLYEETKLCFVGTTSQGEIALSPNTVSDFFYLLYYCPERNKINIIGIKGMEAFKGHKACTFLDHVEDVKLESSFLGHGLIT